ncbi:hypothetical protein [Aquimarina sp. 2304DJ70-9]|uniref:hypothetical protein n=1 Tax=Aquimarina penaris TaxID=3231044 RepID=UPI003463514A
MKKLIYILAFVGIATISCEPLEETYEELDQAVNNAIVGEADYTLTTEDYEALELSFENFSSIEEAKALIPALLAQKYPVWGDKSSANVAFNLNAPIVVEDYTVAKSDYDALIASEDLKGAYLAGNSDINALLAYKYPQSEAGSYVRLSYKTISEQIAYTLTDDDYDLVGNGRFNNFDIRPGRGEEDIAVRIDKISQILLNNFSETVSNQKYLVTYAAFNGSNVDLEILVTYNGTAYEAAATDYTLVDSDYAAIVTGLGSTYPDATSSMDRFGNFERRSGEAAYWSDAMITEAITVVLNNNYPAAEEGSQYSITYSIYDGESGEETVFFEYAGGAFNALTELKVELAIKDETKIYTLTTEWDIPFTLAEEDYTAMEQRFSNFSDEDVAFYNIAIFLKSKFQFARENDMIAVAYNFYDGSTNERYTNFVFDGNAFNAIPSVIVETIKFGVKNGVWVPDNTIKYALTGDDYAVVVAELTGVAGFEEQVSNLDRFGNFNRNGGSTNWDDDQILAAINAVLLKNYPGAEEDQQFVVTYSIYNGSTTTEEISVILKNGEYVLNNDN